MHRILRVTISRGCKTCFNTCTDISSTHSAFIAIQSHILPNRASSVVTTCSVSTVKPIHGTMTSLETSGEDKRDPKLYYRTEDTAFEAIRSVQLCIGHVAVKIRSHGRGKHGFDTHIDVRCQNSGKYRPYINKKGLYEHRRSTLLSRLYSRSFSSGEGRRRSSSKGTSSFTRVQSQLGMTRCGPSSFSKKLDYVCVFTTRPCVFMGST